MQIKMADLTQTNNNEWEDTFDHASDSVFIQDKDFTIVKANKATFDLLKITKEEVIGKKCFQIFHKSGKPWKNCPFEKTRLDKQPHTEEIFDPGLNAHLMVTTSPIFNEAGEFQGSIHIAKNITRQKELELLAKKRAEESQTIIDAVPAMVFYKDKENRFIRVNAFFEKVMGTQKSLLEGKSMFDIYPKEQADAFFKDDLEVMNSGKAKRNIIESMKTPDGTMIVKTDKIPYFNENGEIIGIIGFAIDITEQKKGEEALLASETKYKELADSITDNFTAYDSDLKCVFRNKSAQNNISISNEQAIGKSFEELHPDMIGSEIHKAYLSALQNRKTFSVETEWFHPDTKKTTYHEMAIYPKKEGGIAIISKDITERKKMQKEFSRLASFPELNINPILEADEKGNILYQNPTIKNLFPNLTDMSPSHPWMQEWDSLVKKFADGKTRVISREVVIGESAYLQKIHHLPEQGRVRIYGTDITEQKNKEKELGKLNRTLMAISNSNQLLMRATDETTYLSDVCKIVTDYCGHKLVWIGYTEHNEEKSIKPVASAGFEAGYLDTLKLTWADKERGHGPTGTAIRENKITRCHNMLEDPKFLPWKEEAIKRGYASSIALPLNNGQETFGAITIYSSQPDAFFEEEILLLKELANDIAYGVISIRNKKARDEAEEKLKTNETQLQTEKNTFRIIMQNTKTSLAYLDRDFNFIAVNTVYCRNNGRTEEELIAKNYFDFFPNEETRLLFEKVRDTGNQMELIQKPSIKKNQPWQDITYWDWTITPIKNDENYAQGLVIAITDVTERVKSIENLKVHSQKLEQATIELKKVQTAVENASDIIFIADPRGRIIYINRAVKNILGYRQKELVGRKPNFWMEDMPNKFFGQMWNAIYFNKKPFIGEIQDRKKNGDIFTAEIRIAPVMDKNSQILSFVGIERDITESKRLDQAKTEFISLAAHQLRTPITGVSLAAEMLLRGAVGKIGKESEEYLENITDGVQKMSEMIELFLNVSRIEMKTFPLSPRPINISQVIDENIKAILPQLKRKELEFRKSVADDLPVVNFDKKVLDIVLENLFTNAIKYTQSRGVIGIEAERYRDNITIKVFDTGCGIPEEQQKKVFDKLFRADNSSQKVEGVGLGLYLSKSLIEQSGGKIWLKSEKNAGSAFYVSIPIKNNKTKP